MSDLAKRITELSPEKRAQLRKLLETRGYVGETPTPQPVQGSALEKPLLLEASSSTDPSTLKTSYKLFYDSVSSQLNTSVFGEFSFFLNYGYVPDGTGECAVVQLPGYFINKNSVKLVLELIGDCPVDGKRILDVGCGRGGTIYTFKTFFKPATLTGLDLSTTAIEFNKKVHGDARTSFLEGDAESLPFSDGSFDIVTNVESSHSYPNIHRFYAEVYRVLTSGGHFLYTDALAVQQVATSLAYLDYTGLELKRNRNITRNVLLSCNEVAAARVQAFDGRNDQQLMHNFLATPGSDVYKEMQSGRWEYRIFNLKKRLKASDAE
jgi:phthiocerol/phenolphthiocerol synthesis type-I polyketide synthase E